MSSQWNRYYFILITWGVSMQTSSQYLSRYITRPIYGYSCQLSLYKNISDISLQLCVANCVRDGSCWKLSYNHPGNYCILTDEACVSAEANPNFVMMVFRSNETQSCVQWIPFSKKHGVQNGYPERAIQGKATRNIQLYQGHSMIKNYWQADPHPLHMKLIFLILIESK